ncbi:MAG: polyprenyl synthetase family protein [Muribaculaceae bacterium]|nr:polyprenyl synthetase family protein [Muribaculaceae bacterium]
MKTIKEYSAIINEAIATRQYSEPASLYDPIRYTMEGHGKRLRPVLTLAAADAMNVDSDKAVLPALGVELYHNFTLLHDDIMDNSPTRRGRVAVWKKWDTAQAILSGDTMLSEAAGCMIDSPFAPSQRINMLRCFNETALIVDRGQQYDMDFERRDTVTPDEYLMMIEYKTGALLACACMIGAMCGDASAETVEAFRQYGINLGIAFQIQDDILDVYGDEATLGKPIGGDIVNDKHTWLLISAMEKVPETMDGIYARNLTAADKINAVREVYDSLHLRALAEREVERYMSKAINAITAASLSDAATSFFTDFANSLIGRKK